MLEADPVVEMITVSHVYQGSFPVKALEQVSLVVGRGELVAIVGQSGCGKSTLLKIIAGLLIPMVGRVTVVGLRAEEARRRRKVGIVFQSAVLLSWRTCRENIRLPFELSAARRDELIPKAEIDTHVASLAKAFGLSDFLDAFPSQLSGGMQARVAIARALSYRPEVLLMDEPFGSLDEITRSRLNDDLLALQRDTGVTVVLVTHSIREAAFLASSRVVVLSARPGQVRTVLPVPNVADRVAWRETSDFAAFTRDIRGALEQ
jgi:NitT/TauT family transport system ATP-binding protein